MLYYLLLAVVLSSPSELLKKAAESSRDYNLNLAQQFVDSAKDLQMTDFERAKLFNNQGYIYQEQNRPAEALLQYHESLRYLKSSGDDSDDARYMLTWINNNIAKIYYDYNNHELALQYYDQALISAITLEKAELLYNKSFPQSKLGQTEAALESLLSSVDICMDEEMRLIKENVEDRANILFQIASVRIELGKLFSDSKDYDNSLEYLSKVINNKSLPVYTQAYAHNNFAIASWKNGDYSAAQIHFEKAVQLGVTDFNFVALQNLSEMYLEQGLYHKSIASGTRAEELLANQAAYPENLRLYSFLSKAHEGLGDQESALLYARLFNDRMIEYYQNQENFIDVEQANRIKMITENYEFRVEQLEERKITILINVLISSVILCTLLFLIWRQQNKKKEMVKKIEEELLA